MVRRGRRVAPRGDNSVGIGCQATSKAVLDHLNSVQGMLVFMSISKAAGVYVNDPDG